MSELGLITLSKQDPRFQSYLWGHFSKTERAIPVNSVNINTENEQVTFEVVKSRTFPGFRTFFQTLKFRNLYLSLCPIFIILVKNHLDQTIGDEVLAALSCLAVVCIQLGIELASDIQDHIHGLDRLLPRSSNIALTSAWLSASDLKKISWFLIGLGVLLGLPSIYFFPMIFASIVPLVVVATLGAMADVDGLKYRAWTEFFVFLMFGPLLTVGYQMSFGGGFDLEAIFIGALTGWFALFHIHLKNFSQILVNTQAGFKNSMVRWGFDRAKRVLIMWWMVFVVGLLVEHMIYATTEWLWIHALLLLLVSVPLIVSFNRLEASLGSKCEKAVALAVRVSQFGLALWLLENIWIFLQIETLS